MAYFRPVLGGKIHSFFGQTGRTYSNAWKYLWYATLEEHDKNEKWILQPRCVRRESTAPFDHELSHPALIKLLPISGRNSWPQSARRLPILALDTIRKTHGPVPGCRSA